MPGRYSGRYHAEVQLARKRDLEERHQELWNSQRKYYEMYERNNEKFQTWTSPSLYEENLKKYNEMEEQKKKEKELDEKRNKLDLVLFEEKQKQEIALQEERRNRNRRTHGRFDETPIEILQDINLGLRSVEEAKRRHEAELKLYQHWKVNNPIIRDYGVQQRSVGLKTAWLNAQIEKQMAKEKEEEEMRKLIEERDRKLREEEEREKDFKMSIEARKKEIKNIIEKQLQEIKQKEAIEEALRREEADELRKKHELEEIEKHRTEEMKRKKRAEIDLFNLKQYRLKLRRKAKIVADEILTEKRIYENILDEKRWEEHEKLEEKKRMRESVLKCLDHMKEQQKLEEKRQEYLQFVFDSEAKLMWEQQDRLWREEERAREALFNDVMNALKEQIDKKINDKHSKWKLLAEEKEEMMKHLESYNEDLERTKIEEEKRKMERRKELDSMVNDKYIREKELEEMEKRERIKKIEEAKKEEERIRNEISKMQLNSNVNPHRIPRRRIVW